MENSKNMTIIENETVPTATTPAEPIITQHLKLDQFQGFLDSFATDTRGEAVKDVV
jgi:hypothetical protein